MGIAFIIILVLFIVENVFLFCFVRKSVLYYQKRCCHHCEVMFSLKEIKAGLTHCPHCGQPLESWEDYFEKNKGAEDVSDDEKSKN